VKLKLESEGQTIASVRIETNESSNPHQKLTLKGTCVSPFTVSPRFLDFGIIGASAEEVQVSQETLREKTVTVQCGELEDGSLLSPHSIRVINTNENLHIDQIVSGDRLVLKVGLSSTLKPCRIDSRIAITMLDSDKQHEVAIPVVAEVVAELAVAPLRITLSDASGDDPITFVVWRPSGGVLGPIEQISSPPLVKVEEVSNSGSLINEPVRRRVFRVTPLPSTDGSASIQRDQQTIRLTFAGSKEPLLVPLEY
jgi:hypothetical protein